MKKHMLLLLIVIFISACNGSGSGGTTVSKTKAANEAAAFVNISLVPINSVNLPSLQNMVATIDSKGRWLLMNGLTKGIHQLGQGDVNPNIYVYDPYLDMLYSRNINSTDLPQSIIKQLMSVSPVWTNYNNTLYLIGGYFNDIQNNSYVTLNTISSFNVDDITNAVVNKNSDATLQLAQFAQFSDAYEQFRVTGGEVGVINNIFYLVFGQDCEGDYCQTAQIYTNKIVPFIPTANLTNIKFGNTVYSPESSNSGFRRRDYKLLPYNFDGSEKLLALAGPFTPGNIAYVWTNAIDIGTDNNNNVLYNNQFLNQQANQYKDAGLSIYSPKNNVAYMITFSGLSNLYWNNNNQLIYDNTTPYGNIMDMIIYKGGNQINEYISNSPLYNRESSVVQYMGLGSEFIPVLSTYYDKRGVLNLDKLNGETLVGYFYGGMLSESQEIFGNNNTYTTNQVYAVYVTPVLTNTQWIDVTNRFN